MGQKTSSRDRAATLLAFAISVWLPSNSPGLPVSTLDADIKAPKTGDHTLRILTSNLLELVRVNTKQPGAGAVDSWDWADSNGNFLPPSASAINVTVNGQARGISSLGFKRRPLFAPLRSWDLRIGNSLFIRLSSPLQNGQTVRVQNDGTLWPGSMSFEAQVDPLRHSPAIHVNQEGYLPLFPKKASVGYYLGSMGEMAIPTNSFFLVNASTGASVYEGTLSSRLDQGYEYQPAPYQLVFDADFSAYATPGEYALMVPGLGVSLPFRVDDGVGMNFARTWALGLLHQRSGFNVAMPFTRFTHAADHLAPASVPTNAATPFEFTWQTIADYAGYTNTDNPPQIAPRLTSPSAQLYPFATNGPVDVSGGHFEAANYSKVAWNSAQIIHILMFAVDTFPEVAGLDNMGVPESGDGISDALQEAKWEADCLVKMQDLDGGFYYMIHPVQREYEGDVLPEHGDPQVVWPKNTGSTAAAVAALVQCASSPAFESAYPGAASNYLAKAWLGWRFLTNAIATHGLAGSYQRIMHFDDAFTHMDDLAWAACELFFATGELQYRTLLETWMPDPTSPDTARWGWWRMYASYGSAVRSYAAHARSGRVESAKINQAYVAKCIQAITDCGNDNLRWSQQNAYGSSFPDATKRAMWAGWYYASEQAFDIAVAQEFSPNPAYTDAILRNINFEAGCNPVNASHITGIGLKRQTEVVDQYSDNDRRKLPKIGVPIGNIRGGFVYTWTYGIELAGLCSPSDGAGYAPYPFYDRWSDTWDVTTEASTPNTARCYATALWLAAQTSAAARPWTYTNANILTPISVISPSQPVTVSMDVADPNLNGAKIIWEARDQDPRLGGLSYTFTPTLQEPYWVEAEVHWPDGRRAFAVSSVTPSGATATDPPELRNPQRLADGRFRFLLRGIPSQTYVIEGSTTLNNWTAISTNVLPENGAAEFTDAQAAGLGVRYYRAKKL